MHRTFIYVFPPRFIPVYFKYIYIYNIHTYYVFFQIKIFCNDNYSNIYSLIISNSYNNNNDIDLHLLQLYTFHQLTKTLQILLIFPQGPPRDTRRRTADHLHLRRRVKGQLLVRGGWSSPLNDRNPYSAAWWFFTNPALKNMQPSNWVHLGISKLPGVEHFHGLFCCKFQGGFFEKNPGCNPVKYRFNYRGFLSCW